MKFLMRLRLMLSTSVQFSSEDRKNDLLLNCILRWFLLTYFAKKTGTPTSCELRAASFLAAQLKRKICMLSYSYIIIYKVIEFY